MKNKFVIYLFGLIAISIVFTVACGGNNTDENTELTADSSGKVCLSPSDRNPNGASELAQLMRTMETQTETWRKEISEAKATLSPVPDIYNTLKTAVPTEVEMKNENFNGFSDDFINYSNALVKAPKANRESSFNAMVGGCLACHSQMCPGPVKRIEKFYFLD